jgi:hypothetical protein
MEQSAAYVYMGSKNGQRLELSRRSRASHFASRQTTNKENWGGIEFMKKSELLLTNTLKNESHRASNVNYLL